jgi:hypothetical protein
MRRRAAFAPRATRPGERLLLANTISRDTGIMSHWLIRTDRDMFRNAGYGSSSRRPCARRARPRGFEQVPTSNVAGSTVASPRVIMAKSISIEI